MPHRKAPPDSDPTNPRQPRTGHRTTIVTSLDPDEDADTDIAVPSAASARATRRQPSSWLRARARILSGLHATASLSNRAFKFSTSMSGILRCHLASGTATTSSGIATTASGIATAAMAASAAPAAAALKVLMRRYAAASSCLCGSIARISATHVRSVTRRSAPLRHAEGNAASTKASVNSRPHSGYRQRGRRCISACCSTYRFMQAKQHACRQNWQANRPLPLCRLLLLTPSLMGPTHSGHSLLLLLLLPLLPSIRPIGLFKKDDVTP